MSVLHAEMRRRARRSRDTLHVLYRNELSGAGQDRDAGQQQTSEAEARIASLLPMALQAGVTVAEAARLTGLSRPTLYRMLEGAQSNQTLCELWQTLATAVGETTAALGHDALRDEVAQHVGVKPPELVHQLLLVAPYGWQLADRLAAQGVGGFIDALAELPKLEKTVTGLALLQRQDLGAIAGSLALPEQDVTVHLTLALLRLLPALTDALVE